MNRMTNGSNTMLRFGALLTLAIGVLLATNLLQSASTVQAAHALPAPLLYSIDESSGTIFEVDPATGATIHEIPFTGPTGNLVIWERQRCSGR